MVIAYLIRSKGWSYDEAFKYLQTKRSIVLPNSGFEKQLRAFAEAERSVASK
jgi:protein-tyrosine phosphatase